MEFISKEKKRQVIGVTIFYVLLIFLTAFFLYLRGINTLLPIYVFNVGLDILSMTMGYVLFICCIIDVQKNGTNLRYLLMLLNAAYIACFTDAGAWLVDGIPSLRLLNIADNTLYYMCAPLEACFFWLYTMTYLGLDNKIVRFLGRIVVLGLVIPIVLRFVNLFTGIYFIVTPEGIYERSTYYIFSMFYSFFALISALAAVIIERKKLQKFQIYTFFIYAIAPITVGIISAAIYGLSLTPSVVTLSIFLMYGILNVSQGREKAVADRDLALASSIQENVLPKTFPYLPDRKEFDLYASMNPAKEVGGDFYDFFMVDDDHLCLVIADVSGKGIPAALFMMVSRTLIKNRALLGEEPEKVLYEVNNQLCENNEAELFVTVWMAVISLSTGKGFAVNAGHEHPALRHKDGLFELVSYKHSMAVAAMENIKFKQHEFQLAPGDTLFVYTDGVAEATNSSDELFGTERMINSLNSVPGATPEMLLVNMTSSIDSFVKDAKQFDDITMLAFTYNGP